jgi:signal transduction histidine kinase
MRTLMLELRPAELAQAQLHVLIEQLIAALECRKSLETTVVLDAVDLDPATRLVFYRFVQESLSNVTKHSNATAVAITLTNGTSVELRVSDNGCGFDPSAVPAGHLGLTIMRERAEAVGARLSIDTSPGSGTDLRLSVAE